MREGITVKIAKPDDVYSHFINGEGNLRPYLHDLF